MRIRAQNYEVSTLVWTAFCGSPPDGYIPVPFHLNGDIQDCSIENLAIKRDRDRELRELRRLMVNDYRQPAWRPQPAADYPHGRVKVGGDCIRCRSALSVDGEPDGNTRIWGVGNRVCLTCQRHLR
ncbi:HNH endonuclease [Mycobacteroides abscessus]|uniref:HNH endonuclease n=1 Tax=Mycobacteroides abscessus TaxID=36809 RepID=UPI0034E0755F